MVGSEGSIKARPGSVDDVSTVEFVRQGFFDFFNLPLELREKIYEECLIREREVSPCPNGGWHVHHSATTSLLLVGRQFGAEYATCADRLSSFVFIDFMHIAESTAYTPVGQRAWRLGRHKLERCCHGR